MRHSTIAAVIAAIISVALVGCGGGGGTGNRSPVINSLAAASQRLWPGGNTSVTCNASDPDGDTLTFTWSADEGSFTGGGSTVTWNALNTTGVSEIGCRVGDGKGGSASRSVNVTVAKATVEGTVVDVSSSEGVEGVQVTIDGATATTDAQGNFSVTGVGPGTHSIAVDPPDPYTNTGATLTVQVTEPTTVTLDDPIGVFDIGGGPPSPPPF